MEHTKDVLKKQDSSVLRDGREVHSPYPAIEIAKIAESSQDYQLQKIKEMVRGEISNVAQQHNMETFDEANDFEIEDKFDDTFDEDTRYMSEEYINLPPSQEERNAEPSTTEGQIVEGEGATPKAEKSEQKED